MKKLLLSVKRFYISCSSTVFSLIKNPLVLSVYLLFIFVIGVFLIQTGIPLFYVIFILIVVSFLDTALST